MRYIVNLVFLLFIVSAFYIFTRPLEDISINDLPMNTVLVESSVEPAAQQITPDDSTEERGAKQAETEYYLIIESFKNLTQAQQRAEKFRNDFKTNVIVLPRSKEGYFRISYGKYSSIEEARAAQISLKTNFSHDVWVLTVEK